MLGFGGELPSFPRSAHPWTGVPLLGALTLAGQLFRPPAAPTRPRAAERRDRAGGGATCTRGGRGGWGGGGDGGGRAAARVRRCGTAGRWPLGRTPPASALSPSGSRLPHRLRLRAPCASSFPALRLSSRLWSPHPMCFLLSSRVSCLLYSSHMVARPPGAPRGSRSRVCASLASPRAASAAGLFRLIPPGGPFALGVGSHRWHQLAGVIPLLSLALPSPSAKPHPPFPLLRPVPALASRRTSHSIATTPDPGLTGSRPCPALPICPPNPCCCLGLAFNFPNLALPSPFASAREFLPYLLLSRFFLVYPIMFL